MDANKNVCSYESKVIFSINLLTQYIASYCHIAIVFVPIFLLGLEIQIDYDDEPFLFYNHGLFRVVLLQNYPSVAVSIYSVSPTPE